MTLFKETQQALGQTDQVRKEAKRKERAEREREMRPLAEIAKSLRVAWKELGCSQILDELKMVVWSKERIPPETIVITEGPSLELDGYRLREDYNFGFTLHNIKCGPSGDMWKRVKKSLEENPHLLEPKLSSSLVLKDTDKEAERKSRGDSGEPGTDTCLFNLFLLNGVVGFRIEGGPEIRISLAGSDTRTALIKSIDTSVADYLKTKK